MKFPQLIVHRYAVRDFESTPVEKHKLEKILEAARLAPSAVNFQPWHFIVVQAPENLEKMFAFYQRAWIRKAPVIILACADHSQSWKRGSDGKDYADVDVAIAVDHMALQAAELGLGTTWVCNFNAQKCAETLRLPLHIEPLVMLPLGYPAGDKIPEKNRKPVEEIIHWEKF
ncbi:Nitroreductase [Tangfeifania diversioriginum]|uniref:Nitroreductase n=1 Tax=Tangfeifania diversioriginum TaxID=1168035 RepID=A0A1M6E4I5_9BACT|nr:nitroreductase family protein [Tangfeifania diversioriginum]SHI80412.1 Nitroreductase [Tangfeifania diversioriginum]